MPWYRHKREFHHKSVYVFPTAVRINVWKDNFCHNFYLSFSCFVAMAELLLVYPHRRIAVFSDLPRAYPYITYCVIRALCMIAGD